MATTFNGLKSIICDDSNNCCADLANRAMPLVRELGNKYARTGDAKDAPTSRSMAFNRDYLIAIAERLTCPLVHRSATATEANPNLDLYVRAGLVQQVGEQYIAEIGVVMDIAMSDLSMVPYIHREPHNSALSMARVVMNQVAKRISHGDAPIPEPNPSEGKWRDGGEGGSPREGEGDRPAPKGGESGDNPQDGKEPGEGKGKGDEPGDGEPQPGDGEGEGEGEGKGDEPGEGEGDGDGDGDGEPQPDDGKDGEPKEGDGDGDGDGKGEGDGDDDPDPQNPKKPTPKEGDEEGDIPEPKKGEDDETEDKVKDEDEDGDFPSEPLPPEPKEDEKDEAKKDAPVEHPNYRFFRACLEARKNPLLIGGAGTGKTTIAIRTLEEMGFEVVTMTSILQQSQVMSYTDLTGNLIDPPLVEAVKKNARYGTKIAVIMDEFDASERRFVLVLNELLANRSTTVKEYLRDENGDIVIDPATGHPTIINIRLEVNSDFLIVATANTLGIGCDEKYSGRECMDAATRSRFVTVDWFNTLALQTRLAHGDNALVEFITLLEKAVKEAGLLNWQVDNRDIINVADLVGLGIPLPDIMSNIFKLKGDFTATSQLTGTESIRSSTNKYAVAFKRMIGGWATDEGQPKPFGAL